MTNTDQGPKPAAAQPEDPTMQARDPAMFAPLTTRENEILGAHLISGWHKQSAVYPALSEPWKETSAVIDDLHSAWDITWKERSQGSPSTEPEPEPEAGQ